MKKFFLLTLLALGLVACLDVDQQVNENAVTESMNTVVIPKSFNYNMVREVSVALQHGIEMAGARFKIYDAYPEEGGRLLSEGCFDESGKFNGTLKISDNIKTLYIKSDYITLDSVMLDILDNKIIYNYTDENDKIIATSMNNKSLISKSSSGLSSTTYLSSYNAFGRPNNLNTPRPSLQGDYFSKLFRLKLNATFNDGWSIPGYMPDLVNLKFDREITLTEDSSLDLFFVHKGGVLNNSLAYYTYTKGNEPNSISLSDLKFVFPNASTGTILRGSYLLPGDSVNIGNFKKDTVVGFVLVSDGWGLVGPSVNTSKPLIYTNPKFNGNKVKSVMLYDKDTDYVVFGFEDSRNFDSSDKDMDDAIFAVKSSVSNGIKKDNFPILSSDAASYDSTPIYEYYPSKGNYNTLAFEDLWPSQGDYDMNDLVVSYNYEIIKNNKEEVNEIKAKFKIKAAGGGINNGLGIELDIDSNKIEKISGYDLRDSIIKLNSKGLENNQNKAVVIVFDNSKKIFGDNGIVNTQKEKGILEYKTIEVSIKFVSGTKISDIKNKAPFNPFMFRTFARGYEIHLPTGAPTSLANMSLFNTVNDATEASAQRYYRTANNLPWAIDVPYDFEYPVEGKAINFVYKRFVDWAKSGGTQYTDWYRTDLNKTGYFDKNLMY